MCPNFVCKSCVRVRLVFGFDGNSASKAGEPVGTSEAVAKNALSLTCQKAENKDHDERVAKVEQRRHEA